MAKRGLWIAFTIFCWFVKGNVFQLTNTTTSRPDISLEDVNDTSHGAWDAFLSSLDSAEIELKKRNITFLSQPSNTTADEGESLLIRCTFLDDDVEGCEWTLNGSDVFVGYRFSTYHNYTFHGSLELGDCSVRIKEVAAERDRGSWQCHLLLDNGRKQSSKPGFVRVIGTPSYPTIYYEGKPVPRNAYINATFIVGQPKNATVTCISRKNLPAVELYWNINYSSKKVEGRLTKTKNKNDPSLWDTQTEIDIVPSEHYKIECALPYKSSSYSVYLYYGRGRERTVSNYINATVIDEKNIQITNSPSYQQVNEGENVIFVCKFNGSAENCTWKFNNSVVPVGNLSSSEENRFVFNGDRKNGDCSLKIKAALLHKDSGNWTCQLPQIYGNTLSSIPANLSVYVKPTLPMIYFQGEATNLIQLSSSENRSGSAIVHCVSRKGYPGDELMWIINGKNERERVIRKYHSVNSEDQRLWDSYSYLMVSPDDENVACVSLHPSNFIHLQEVMVTVRSTRNKPVDTLDCSTSSTVPVIYKTEPSNIGIVIGLILIFIVVFIGFGIIFFMYKRSAGKPLVNSWKSRHDGSMEQML